MFKPWKPLPFGGALLVAACLVSSVAGREGSRMVATSENRDETTANADLIARVAALEEAQLNNGMSTSYEAHGDGCGCCGGCESCCGDCWGCGDSCCCSHVYGVYESVFLKPHFSRDAAFFIQS